MYFCVIGEAVDMYGRMFVIYILRTILQQSYGKFQNNAQNNILDLKKKKNF